MLAQRPAGLASDCVCTVCECLCASVYMFVSVCVCAIECSPDLLKTSSWAPEGKTDGREHDDEGSLWLRTPQTPFREVAKGPRAHRYAIWWILTQGSLFSFFNVKKKIQHCCQLYWKRKGNELHYDLKYTKCLSKKQQTQRRWSGFQSSFHFGQHISMTLSLFFYEFRLTIFPILSGKVNEGVMWLSLHNAMTNIHLV